ncbi:hypothetical protein VITU9109_04842 [Vibrio tubiashii ATCC 19109]|uniref:Uncharacterized protein n=1 Tax=Vibrio tubiashii ATCC 19109 TaxID=1051646 RepID=A0ABP2LCX7_9VIBR|nr:hypothetical protein VITU9109_04842 [Vibrio tubiashii ATCC 19109]
MAIEQFYNQNTIDKTCLAKNAFEEANCQVRKADLVSAMFQHPRNHNKELNKHTISVS